MLKKYIHNSMLLNIAEWLLTFGGAVFIFLLLQAFVIKNANVTGDSMEPTFNHGDKVLVFRFAYWFSEPSYGDIIAFQYKKKPSTFYIKRIIGKPGDEIDLIDNEFLVNGESLTDRFSWELVSSLGDIKFPVTVGENSYFVLGDNRNVSMDSRFSDVGCVPKNEVVGKISLRIFPFDKIGFVGDGS